MALRLITDHIKDCTQARIDTKSAINDVRNLLLGFIGAVFIAVVGFAGYTYSTNQSLEHEREASMETTIRAIQATPDATARKVAQTQAANQ